MVTDVHTPKLEKELALGLTGYTPTSASRFLQVYFFVFSFLAAERQRTALV
jgi:hypothetical protein